MRFALNLLILAFAAAIFSVPWSIAMDLALYQALSRQLGDSSMRIATKCIDDTELTRAMGLFAVLMFWSVFVLAMDRLLGRLTRRKQTVIARCD
jgi:hypothetical protein